MFRSFTITSVVGASVRTPSILAESAHAASSKVEAAAAKILLNLDIFIIDCGSNLLELLRRKFQFLLSEIHISLCRKRNQMDMGVRYLHSKHGHPYPLAWNSSLDGLSDLPCKCTETGIGLIVEVEDVIFLCVLRDTSVCPV